ncbi:ASCH domain-containing protein [Kitasatospora sp. NPDC048722]|uniref:ASCH domain-containing protein n=1 Tax=Kitasatospora sp. NPDC048722 TaxID=3155639 RepID=UPI00340A2CA2
MSIDPQDMDPEVLPKAAFAFPGPLRDRLVAAILDGSKTATTALLADYELHGEPLPCVGRRSAVVDSADRPVAITEVTDVRVVPLGEVGISHARDEGEGHDTVEEWRADHEEFWHSTDMRDALGDPGFTVHDTTPVVLERFHVATRLHGPS